tara:strand:+ start:124 stop:303 length:180 start_codon:yes stop_codon:yes gene_type:complete
MNETILRMLAIFWNMVKEAILRAFRHVLIISALLILPSIYPLYLMTGMMTRQMHQDKIN